MFLVVSAYAMTLMVDLLTEGRNNTSHTNPAITNAGDESAPIPICSWLILAAELTVHMGGYLTLFTIR